MASDVPVNVQGLWGKPFVSKEIKQNCIVIKKNGEMNTTLYKCL